MKPCAINIADGTLASATLHMAGTRSLALHISDSHYRPKEVQLRPVSETFQLDPLSTLSSCSWRATSFDHEANAAKVQVRPIFSFHLITTRADLARRPKYLRSRKSYPQADLPFGAVHPSTLAPSVHDTKSGLCLQQGQRYWADG